MLQWVSQHAVSALVQIIRPVIRPLSNSCSGLSAAASGSKPKMVPVLAPTTQVETGRSLSHCGRLRGEPHQWGGSIFLSPSLSLSNKSSNLKISISSTFLGTKYSYGSALPEWGCCQWGCLRAEGGSPAPQGREPVPPAELRAALGFPVHVIRTPEWGTAPSPSWQTCCRCLSRSPRP